jgi:methyl-accepting chemotaxis protein
MFGWNNLSIRVKLPAAFATVALAVALILSIGSGIIGTRGQLRLTQDNLTMTGMNRHDLLHEWLNSVSTTVRTSGNDSNSLQALYALSAAFKELGADGKSFLQSEYIANNPNPVGKRQLMDRAEGSEYYHSQHALFHNQFRKLTEQLGFYDIFLIDNAGNVVYTVSKESDFGENLKTGRLKDSSLAAVFDKASKGKANDIFVSDFTPYEPSGNSVAMFVATPIMNPAGKTVGVYAIQLPLAKISDILDRNNLAGTSTNIYLLNNTGQFLSNSRFPNEFKAGDTAPDLQHIVDGLNGKEDYYQDTQLMSGNVGFARSYQIETNAGSWTLVIERDKVDVFASLTDLLILQIAFGVTSVIVSLIIGLWVSKSFSKPISQLNKEISNVAAGDYQTQIQDISRKDEFGSISKSIDLLRQVLAVNAAQEALRESKRAEQSIVVEQLKNALRNLATGDLTQGLPEPFAPEYEVLREYFNDAISKMDDVVSQISSATEGIHAQAGEITRSSEELAHRTEVQAATLEQTAAAMDEMTVSVKSAAAGVEEVETIVRDARKDADQSGIVVKEAVAAMAEIEKSSDQISQIIGVIDDIAFQTNLLALNAGVEAARAGDAGRGFAVVASEVGALAQRASSAAKEIKGLISTSSQHVERGVERVKQAGDALQQIARRVTHISSLTSNIATGSREQSIGLNEINLGVTQLDQATQKNAAMAEEATAASQLLKQGAGELSELVGRFKLNGHQLQIKNLVDFSPMTNHAEETATTEDGELQMAVGSGGRGIWQDF